MVSKKIWKKKFFFYFSYLRKTDIVLGKKWIFSIVNGSAPREGQKMPWVRLNPACWWYRNIKWADQTGLEVIKLEYSLKLKIKHNHWLRADKPILGLYFMFITSRPDLLCLFFTVWRFLLRTLTPNWGISQKSTYRDETSNNKTIWRKLQIWLGWVKHLTKLGWYCNEFDD